MCLDIEFTATCSPTVFHESLRRLSTSQATYLLLSIVPPSDTLTIALTYCCSACACVCNQDSHHQAVLPRLAAARASVLALAEVGPVHVQRKLRQRFLVPRVLRMR
jgi:hypothetical protein